MIRISTGIVGLNGMLGGGIPLGRVILVRGNQVQVKRFFSLQFIVEGIKKGT